MYFLTKHNPPSPFLRSLPLIAKIALWIMASTSAIEWGTKKTPYLFISMINLSTKKNVLQINQAAPSNVATQLTIVSSRSAIKYPWEPSSKCLWFLFDYNLHAAKLMKKPLPCSNSKRKKDLLNLQSISYAQMPSWRFIYSCPVGGQWRALLVLSRLPP
jgi:hypothetical protein